MTEVTGSPPLIERAWKGREGLRSAEPAWREILSTSGVDRLFNSPTWCDAYAEAYLEDDDVFGWTLEASDGAPMAVLAFRREPARGTFALRRATFLADGSFDSDYLDLVIRPGHERAAVERGLELLARERGLDAVVLSGIPNDSTSLPVLHEILERRHLPSRERPVDCCAATLAPTMDEYVATLKSRVRSKVRSSLRRAHELGAVFGWCDDPKTLSNDLEGLYDLHTRRWRSIDEPGSFSDPRRRKLYDRLMPRLLERGALRLSRLDLDGRPIAYQLGIVEGDTYYQLQEGYDPDRTEFRVGNALRAESVSRLIEEGVRRYDFMAGIARHKTEWGAKPRPCTTIAFALPRWRARLAYGLRAWIDRRNSARTDSE